ncbi:hypothetical protein [Yinghuangia seranimata]|uniref:hypothetical protein n=1 Tax=Yinghuangia seranimata TaxID=408067 RepID=UPI00248ACADA|nr:hypothetical protein [Yinghuangia seranimata]MDI2128748.1 hypothetical protein [Yinghuangia seranimata]
MTGSGFFDRHPRNFRARVLDDADRTARLALDFNEYELMSGRDRAFSDVIFEGLTPPLNAFGELDADAYPPPGHDYPTVG